MPSLQVQSKGGVEEIVGRSAVFLGVCVLASLHICRSGVVIPGADEERTALGINRGWLPYRATAVLVCPPAVVGHVEGLPKDRTVLSVERHYTAAKAATRIRGVRRQSLFIRRDANINNPVEDNRRSGNDCGVVSP